MHRRLAAGLIAAVLGLANAAPYTLANETIDPTTTSALPPAAAVIDDFERGSPQFRAALIELRQGDPAVAFAMAGKLTSDVERRTIQWAAINFNAGKVGYWAIEAFAVDAPDFAAASLYRTRVEQSLTANDAPQSDVMAALGARAPSTVDGQISLAAAYLAKGDKDKATTLARSLWVDNFLTEEQETRVLAQLGSLLDRPTHWARAVYLMMHDRARASERLTAFLSPAQQSLVTARAAVSRNDSDAKALLDKVDPSMRANPVYIFSRAQRARQFELWQSAADWLAKAPADLPDSAEWWYERRALMRKLLDLGQPKLAYEVAAGYQNGPEGRMVDAQFHAGWIAISFLHDPASAKKHFTEMAVHSTLPDTVSQSNYWLARANAQLGDTEGAEAALRIAARYRTVYYGQLARTELGETGIGIRPLPDVAPNAIRFNSNQVVRAIRLLAANGQSALAVPLLRNFGTGLTSDTDLALAAKLAQEIGAYHLAIAIATTADQRGTPLDILNFPQADLPPDLTLPVERAAVYAITRQESMFQLDAVSPAGARGLMQLMPGTAQDVARKVGVEYSPNKLVTDASYNALLGSTYLGAQLDRYNGSLVLAAAAYNAGPGNADKWIRAYGDPREDNVDPVIWVELIPFQETRTYVKRVLGNYLVYRERLGDSPLPLQQALRTIR
ncbi:lytic transglycosylase domain-containing protein [Devosia sp. 2618]|uniref:lytic transglycosylase domain-containing protein n=1 Tax=Devosia sp. 2618 TaxID=3156454 RepID=UPI0033926AB0